VRWLFLPFDKADFLLRTALEKATIDYLHAHFKEGVSSVFSPKGDATHYTIQIVANKYNPNNYWYDCLLLILVSLISSGLVVGDRNTRLI